MKGIPLKQMIKVLSDEQVDHIHEASVTILERTGVRFDGPDARRRLLAAGALAHPSRKDVVLFPRGLVEGVARRSRRDVTYYARDPTWNVTYDGEHTYPYSGGGNPKIIDSGNGSVRPSTYADVEQAARLGDALENNHSASHLVIANDVPPAMVELKTMEAAMKNSSKVMSHHATSAATVEFMMKMWSCVSGGEEEFRKRPLFSLASSPSSPLTYSKHVCEVLVRSAELGVPFSVIPCPIAGETGPITLSGSLALQNAETLAGLVLLNSINESIPSVYCGRVCIMDPRTGRDLWGVPEEGLVSAAIVQLAKRYGMVSDTCGTASDVTNWGMQMGIERMRTALVPILAGSESVSGMGDGWDGASSLEMMVIDNDIFSDIADLMHRVCSISWSRTDNGQDITKVYSEPLRSKVAPGGGSECDLSRTSDVIGLDRTIVDARVRVKEILKDHTPLPLDRDIERDVDRVIKEAKRLLA